MPARALLLLSLGLALPACRSSGSKAHAAASASAAPGLDGAAPATASAPPAPASASPRPPSALDEVFEPWVRQLPAPATLSEGNGASLSCPRHEHATYTLLEATAKKVPLESDRALVELVPWLRHDDACIRQIAIDALLPKLGLEANRFAVPPMHDPEHHQYHQIVVALRAHLDERRVPYAPGLFDGLMLGLRDADFGATLQGSWQEEISKSHNFQTLVKLDGKLLEVTSTRTEPDPKWPDHTMTSQIDKVSVNAQQQFVVTSAWRVESRAGHPAGARVEPSDLIYAFWPVSRDVVWFDQGRAGGWVKLRRR